MKSNPDLSLTGRRLATLLMAIALPLAARSEEEVRKASAAGADGVPRAKKAAPEPAAKPAVAKAVPMDAAADAPASAPRAEAAEAGEPQVWDPEPPPPVFNGLILGAIKSMPSGGGYSVGRQANAGLKQAISTGKSGLGFDPAKARPSYCSGATYQVFVRALSDWNRKQRKTWDPEAAAKFLVEGQADGDGVWGRWNANGPGTARLFHETGLGVNFRNWENASPGDFMKIWWNTHVGKRESGHSVIFLGVEKLEDGFGYRFWSSNQPDGYGEKVVPFTKVKRVLFSRLLHPEAATAVLKLPKRDDYLHEMLTRDSSIRELCERTGIQVPKEAPSPVKNAAGGPEQERRRAAAR